MSRDTIPNEDAADAGDRVSRRALTARGLGKGVLGLLLVALLVIGIVWTQREQVARNYIDDLLRQNDVPATYDIEEIGPQRQVIRNIVVGDPAAPDLLIDRAEVRLVTRFGMPRIRSVTLDGLRVWGRVVDGQPSFGALDPLIFTDSEEPFALPDFALFINDGRGLIEGDHGAVAFKLDGGGHLQDGFSARLAATAPTLRLPGCAVLSATLYGTLDIAGQRPGFAGPFRFGLAECADAGVRLGAGGIELDLRADEGLAGLEGDFDALAGSASFPGGTAASAASRGHLAFIAGDVLARFTLDARGLDAGGVRMAAAGFDGALRSADSLARLELDGEVAARGLQTGALLESRLADAIASSRGTLAEPLLAQARSRLMAESRMSTLTGRLTVRSEGGRTALVVPEARLAGQSGASLVQVSRMQVAMAGRDVPRITGNFATGGTGLPRITGRMEQDGSGALELRLSMAPYEAGSASLAVPAMRLRQAADGALGFSGQVLASGAVPGGTVRGLELPISGTLSPGGSLVLWRACTDVRFSALALGQVALEGQRLTLCPPRGRAIVQSGTGGLSVVATMPGLRLRGLLGDSALALSSGTIGLAWPGTLVASDVQATLGSGASASTLSLARVEAQLAQEITGQFAGASARIGTVPLAIDEAGGSLAFADGVLSLSGASFTLADRQAEERFHPMQARNVALVLAGGRVTSAFALHHPASGAEVARVDLAHDLASGTGQALLLVEGLTFREGFQPRDLIESLYGTASNVSGTITGRGQVQWSAEGVTSSTGTFASEGLDLAAPFGPVRGARGTVEFTDLVGLTTAPGQRIQVASINPGIEVLDGELAISLIGGTQLQLEQARWPFLGGTIEMRPLALNIGTEEVRRYVIEIRGLEAQRFIDHMALSNIAATGVFDGTIPVVFDAQGFGRLEGGVLISRPPGGNVSYIGDLTYEDLSPIANYAFAALRDMDYDMMRIQLDGALTGELVTSVRFDGVRQGQGAESNFITRRLARLPIRFVVNVRAPFYSMMSDLRSLYDPSAVRDPRGLGLLVDDGTRFVPATRPDRPSDEPTIQPPESEALP